VVDIFGNISPNALSAGMHAVHPFAVIHKQPVTTQEIKESMHVRSKEGLNIQLDVSCFWHVPEASWPMIMKTVSGADPLVLLVPNFRSVARDISANYEAKALYSADRSVLSNQMKSNLDSILSSRGIVIEETPMRQVTLPANVSDAIEEKLAAEQEAQRMQFVLQKEQQEAERKRIEAQGIKDFQRIVSEGISDKLLQWKGIEATEKIAESTNSKIVIIGAGKDGLPVILNQ
jgi:regulator of protease activity HflC (stomatin/prohibitin superfamily)